MTLEEKENTTETEPLPPRDIICAFNYSCCYLHSLHGLGSYFKHALGALSKNGRILLWIYMEVHHLNVNLECKESFQILRIHGSKLVLIWCKGKQELACIIRSKRRNYVMHFYRAGDCGHHQRLKIVWKKRDFSPFISGLVKC